MENKNIYQKLFEVKKAGIKLKRDTKAYNYKYATLDQIQNKLGDVLEKEKLLVLHKILENKVITIIYNLDNIEEKVESEIQMSENIKAQDRGSEITYYRRYNLLALLDLEVEDDDGEKAQYSQKLSGDEDSKEWFSEENFKNFEKIKDKFQDGKEAVKKAREKYKVSKAFAQKIENLYGDYCEGDYEGFERD